MPSDALAQWHALAQWRERCRVAIESGDKQLNGIKRMIGTAESWSDPLIVLENLAHECGWHEAMRTGRAPAYRRAAAWLREELTNNREGQ